MGLLDWINLKLFRQEVIKRSLEDLSVELADEFDQNFARKSFFGKPWQRRKFDDGRGSLLMRSGSLRRSIEEPRIAGNGIRFSSGSPYAAIHNDGGQIRVTPRMKAHFWKMYYEASGSISRTASGTRCKTKRNRALNAEAEFYRAMALKKVGSIITIPQRQFVGDDPEVEKLISRIVNENINQFFKK